MSFNNIGKPVPTTRRQTAYNWLRSPEMGFDADTAHSLVGAMADRLERDKPYEAQQVAFGKPGKLDLTGTYRLMAYLLCDEK